MSNKVILEKLFKVAYNQQIILEKLAQQLPEGNAVEIENALNLFIKSTIPPFLMRNSINASESHESPGPTDITQRHFDINVFIKCNDKKQCQFVQTNLPKYLNDAYNAVLGGSNIAYKALNGFSITFNVTAS